jgi:hypothetical protein
MDSFGAFLHRFREYSSLHSPQTIGAAERLADKASRIDSIRDVPHTAAALGIFTGVPRARVGLLRHISLSRAQLTGGMECPEPGASVEMLRIARHVRRHVVRLMMTSPKGASTDCLHRVLNECATMCAAQGFPVRTLPALTMSVEKCRAHLTMQASGKVPHDVVAESFATLLGEFREIARAHYRSGSTVKLSESPETDEVALLRNALRARAVYARQAAERLDDKDEPERFQTAITRLRTPISTTMSEWYQPGAGRSVPVRFIQAARRSVAGVHLAHIEALQERVEALEHKHDPQELRAVAELLTRWKTAEGRGQYEARVAPSFLTKNVFSVPGFGNHSFFRDVVTPAVSWAALHGDTLSIQTYGDVERLCRATVSCLTALTLLELSEFYSGSVRIGVKSQRPDVGIRGWKEKLKEWARRSSTPEPYVDRFETCDHRSLWGKTAVDVSRFLRHHPNIPLAKGERAVRTLADWGDRCAKRYGGHCEYVKAAVAILATEFDPADGCALSAQVQKHFVALQERYRVEQGARESGFVEPESVEWLQDQLSQHDGILLSVSQASLGVPISAKDPYGLCVLTFSQRNPSSLMHKILEVSAGFIERLPQETIDGAKVNPPRVLAELVVATSEGRELISAFGEAPYQVLNDQALFNVVSRFPYQPRVDLFAICREGSVAMKAHSRFGWIKTGSVYQDERGTRFDVIYRAIHPAAILLGYRDLSHP